MAEANMNITGTATAEPVNTTNQTTATPQTTEPVNTAPQSEPLTTEAIERLIQSRVDRAQAEMGKKIATLQKENAKLKREKLDEEGIKKLEAEEREKAFAEREKDLLDRENRLFAIKAIKEIGLDDGSERALSLVDFVMDAETEKITARVKAFNDLVQSFVSAKVDEKFKAIGRTPTGATQTATAQKETSVAEALGKSRAEQAKKSSDIRNAFLGGRR